MCAGDNSVKEGRCNGLSGRFMGVKVGGKCDKHGDKHNNEHGDKHADRQPRPDMAHTDEPMPKEDRPDMPGARRSLAGHHDKHDNKKHGGKGKHHDAAGSELESDKHHGKHGDKKAHQKLWDSADMTFEDVEGIPAAVTTSSQVILMRSCCSCSMMLCVNPVALLPVVPDPLSAGTTLLMPCQCTLFFAS